MTDVVALEMSMEYGSLHQILNILNEEDIQIEYMYAFPFKNKATAVIRTSDLEKTALVLEQKNQHCQVTSQLSDFLTAALTFSLHFLEIWHYDRQQLHNN